MIGDLWPVTRVEQSDSRTIFGDDGRYWTVFEVGPGRYDRRRSKSLVFWAENTVMRRVRDFPENWLELDDGQLYALMLVP